MAVNTNYFEQINTTKKQIDTLPPTEIKYYLYLLVGSIQETNSEKTQEFLNQLIALITSLQNLHQLADSDEDAFQAVNDDLLKLQEIAQTHTIGAKITNALLSLAGAILALVLAIIGGFIGTLAGLGVGIWEFKPFNGFYVGLLTGLGLGIAIGYRTPMKLFKNEMQRQLKFGLDGAQECLDKMLNHPKSLADYQTEVEQELRELFDTESDFNDFKEALNPYTINSLKATFIDDPMLAGYIGEHTYIRFEIQNKTHLIEFVPDPSDLSKPTPQSEQREVTGSKLIEMLAYHRKLQETHTITNEVMLTKIKPGDNDCLSYLHKILIGTNQEVTQVRRFYDMKPAGTMTGAIIDKLSPFKPGFFKEAQEEIRIETQSPSQRMN